MRCRTCGGAMVEDHRESGGSATARWHACPLCRTKRLTSEPDRPSAQALSTVADAAEDDGAYAGDPAPTGPDLEA